MPTTELDRRVATLEARVRGLAAHAAALDQAQKEQRRMHNLKTTVAGTLTIAIPVLGGFLKRFYLNEPLVEADWAIIGAAIATGTGLIFAGDATPSTTAPPPIPAETKVP